MKEDSTMRKIASFLAGGLIATSIIFAVESFAAKEVNTDAYKNLVLFGDVFERVRAEYVTVPNETKMIQGAINGMLTSLDPHSSYLTPEETKEMYASTKGSFGGIGITVMKDKDGAKVVSSLKGTPAAKAGILVDDIIIAVNEKSVKGEDLNAIVEKMRGKIGTSVTLTISRQGKKDPLKFTLLRQDIKIDVVSSKVKDNVGYLKLAQFSGTSHDDLEKAIRKIQKQIPSDKLKGYILDLRLNPGGLLDQAVKVSSLFLDGGEVVSTRGRDPSSNLHFDTEGFDIIKGKPLIVLINGGSASAAEIVSGALKDHHRAIILGTRSFGKGSVQKVLPLVDNGAIRLTTALYYTPSGKSIQGKGISPDITVIQPLPEKYKNYKVSIGESELRGHIKGQEEDGAGSGSSIYVPKDEKDDVQLLKAYNLLNGKENNPIFSQYMKQYDK